MKFAHLADCHLGSWREPKMRDANGRAFRMAVNKCVSENVDFVLISGDLFNNSFPSIDVLKLAVDSLRFLKEHGIPVYVIPGSHDFSPSGKTILDVLESAGLLVNVSKGEEHDGKLRLSFTVDSRTGAKIAGLFGKKAGLEKSYFELLDRQFLESESGYKIFMFHSTLSEFKPKDLAGVDGIPVSFLPQNFDYYAGGHVHIIERFSLGSYKNVVYPGPVFPNSFSEVEKLGKGSMVIVEDNNVSFHSIVPFEIVSISLDVNNKTPVQVVHELVDSLYNIKDKIIAIRLSGCLSAGRPSDIDWDFVLAHAYKFGAYFVMRNTSALHSNELETVHISESDSVDIEDSLIKEHLGQIVLGDDEVLTKELMKVFGSEKKEGERVVDYESRLGSDADSVLDV